MSRIVLLFLALTLPLSANAQDRSAEELFQQALQVERISSNPEAAIVLYRQVVDMPSANRELVARAWLQMGKAYEVLGEDGARQAYSRVVSDFSDLRAIAGEASERMAGLAASVTPPETRRSIAEKAPFSTTSISLDGKLALWGPALSPSGRFFAASDSAHNIVQVELETGERRTIVQGGWAQFVRYSPNEKELAYGWWGEDDRVGSIKIVSLESGAVRSTFDIKGYFARYQDFSVAVSDHYVLDWTKDGSSLLVLVEVNKLDNDHRGDPDYRWVDYLLMVPTDGSIPHVIAKDEELEFWQWWNPMPACLAGNDRFAMMDHNDGNRSWIVRMDVTTGEQVPWRKSDDSSFSLSACPGAPDNVLYVSEYLGVPYMMAGNAEDIDPPRRDRTLTSVESIDSKVYAYSEKADLLIGNANWAVDGMKLIAIGADPQTGTLLSKGATLDEKCCMALPSWDPSGNQLSWISTTGSLSIWNRATDQTRTISVEGLWRNTRWFPDGSRLGVWGPESGVGGTTQKFSIINLETGLQSDPITGKFLGGAIGADGKSLIVGDDDGIAKCLDRLDLTTQERTPFFCLEGGPYEGLLIREYHDYSRYLIVGYTDYFTTSTFGVVDSVGSNWRMAYEHADSGNFLGWPLWSSPEHIAFAMRAARGGPIDSIAQVSIDSGEVSPMYASIFSDMEVRGFQVSPDGETVVFYARPLQSTEADSAYILHNVLGE